MEFCQTDVNTGKLRICQEPRGPLKYSGIAHTSLVLLSNSKEHLSSRLTSFGYEILSGYFSWKLVKVLSLTFYHNTANYQPTT